jgi:hypothetical protein
VRRRYVKMPAYNPKTGLYHGRGGSSDGLRPPRGKAADVPVRKVEPEGKE